MIDAEQRFNGHASKPIRGNSRQRPIRFGEWSADAGNNRQRRKSGGGCKAHVFNSSGALTGPGSEGCNRNTRLSTFPRTLRGKSPFRTSTSRGRL